MTRINCIPVEELSRQHLVAEYRELPRVFALAQKASERNRFVQPANYTLGTGHVTFFYTRLEYLAKRHAQLVAEMLRRGYKPTFTGSLKDAHPTIPQGFWADWEPTDEAMAINRARILERSRNN
ncbi:MAG TPA: pyrimidine dimer DNA glycosylase/endonuclease V [Candidimonas sp.]|nr:pyrimidine dimer DNA glycosylase/endonuclease V [Candidimonas sp.]